MKKNFIAGILLITTVTLTACKNNNQTETSSNQTPAVEKPVPATAVEGLPSFKMTDEKGNAVELGSLKGKKVFVNMWASWCPPCRMEMPSIYSLYNKVDKEKVAFVFLSLDENAAEATAFTEAQQMKIPVFFPAENPPALFNVQGIPATFIFNEKGELIKKMEGMDNYDTEEYVNLLKG